MVSFKHDKYPRKAVRAVPEGKSLFITGKTMPLRTLDITPDNLEISDNVTVEWHLTNNAKG